MAKSDEGLASLQLTKGLLAEAESGFRSAAAILEPLVGQESEADLYVVDLALAYTHIGMVCTDRDDPQGALPWFERAFSCLNTVLKKKPRHTMALEFANEAHVGKALALTALGRYDLARPDWEEAFSTRRDALVTNHYAVWQALCSTTHRQFAEALSQARRLDKTALVSGDLPLIYQLAQVYALTADGMARPVQPSSQQHSAGESESCARRAIELLEFLRAQNFFTKKTRRTLFQSDRAFACLRTRADFVSLAFEPGSETR
jgi:tetratricopeptide (TPR) repeat protein